MKYDIQIGNVIRRGLSYAELVVLHIGPDTPVRRENSDWITAKECVELSHVISFDTSPDPITYIPQDEAEYIDDPDEAVDESGYCIRNDSFDDSFEDDVEDDIYEPEDNTDYDYMTDYDPSQSEDSLQYRTETPPPEERFIPTAEYLKCEKKRKKAIIGVCTLGLSALWKFGIVNTWRSNIFENTSLSAMAGISFILKCVSFMFLTALLAIPYFIYSFLALIYYSIRLNRLKK